MDVYEAAGSRMSVRSYKHDPVSKETVIRILEAARRAPSWANKQCWRFIVVDSQVEKKIIGKASGQANIAKACEEAPYIIVLCANSKESGVKNGMEYFMFDCGLAMENLVLTAQSEGLSTCIVGWFDEKAVKAVLKIPEDFKVVAFTPLGYGNEKLIIRSRKKQDETVYCNIWGRGLE